MFLNHNKIIKNCFSIKYQISPNFEIKLSIKKTLLVYFLDILVTVPIIFIYLWENFFYILNPLLYKIKIFTYFTTKHFTNVRDFYEFCQILTLKKIMLMYL